MQKKFIIQRHIVLESVGTEILALHPDGHVWRFSGEAADSVRSASNAGVEENAPGVSELVDRGIVVPLPTLDRRKVLTGGAVAAGLAVSSLALPSAALASSEVQTLKGLLSNLSGKVSFVITAEYVAPNDPPTAWFPNPKPSSDISEVSSLTVGDVVVPLDQESSYLGQQQSNSLTWTSNIDFASSPSSYTGSFTWSRHRFSVEFLTVT